GCRRLTSGADNMRQKVVGGLIVGERLHPAVWIDDLGRTAKAIVTGTRRVPRGGTTRILNGPRTRSLRHKVSRLVVSNRGDVPQRIGLELHTFTVRIVGVARLRPQRIDLQRDVAAPVVVIGRL